MHEDIERVKVNGMTMYRMGNQLFLSKTEAIREAREQKEKDRSVYIHFDGDDPIAMALAGKIRGRKLG